MITCPKAAGAVSQAVGGVLGRVSGLSMTTKMFESIMVIDHATISRDQDCEKNGNFSFSGKSSCRGPNHQLASNCNDDH